MQTVDSRWILIDCGLFRVAWRRLDPRPGDLVTIDHPRPPSSMSAVRSKIYGNMFDDGVVDSIVSDLVAERRSDIESAAFTTACASHRSIGKRYGRRHGPWLIPANVSTGLPGNRTTPIVTTDTIAHPANVLDVAPDLAGEVARFCAA